MTLFTIPIILVSLISVHAAKTDYGSCTIASQTGICISTSSCSTICGFSTPGYCPGPTDIQCCTRRKTDASCGAPGVNNATLTLVEEFEGWSADVYDDPDGNPTIGWGHLCSSSSCEEIPYDIPLTKSDGALLLQSDLLIARKCIASLLSNITLNANQYGALVSWAFNEGCGNTGSSTLVKRLNSGEEKIRVIEEELPKWNRGSNGVLPGLVRRRKSEVVLFETGTGDGALPVNC